MTTMVEKVARAMAERSKARVAGMFTIDSLPMDGDEDFVALARAAIEAMAAPTSKMCKAACAAMSPGKRPTPNRVSHKAKHAIRYRAMIQAALEEKQ